MRKPIVFLFSGQGSHHYQMGRALFETQFLFQAWMEKGDRIIRARWGTSILEEIYATSRYISDRFVRTRYSHPAIFLVEFSLAQTLIEQGLEPDSLLGASMGCFAALAVAGVLSFEDAMLAVMEQAEMLESCCQPGGMVAILASPNLYEQTPWLFQQSTLAGINFDKHFVIAASQEKLPNIQRALKDGDLTAQELPVSHAFHSSMIDPAADAYRTFLRDLSWRHSQLPLYCCATAAERTDLPPDYLWTVVREPIRFRQTMTYLETRDAWTYIDVGPSSTLATFVKYNLPEDSASDLFPIMSPFGQEVQNLEKLLRSGVGRE